MREAKQSWVRALRALTGNEHDTIRWNMAVARWEFVMSGADGVPRSQFWGRYKNPLTGERLEPDPVTGLYPFRELDDETMKEALRNLEKTFVGNPHDGAGTTQREVMQRYRYNKGVQEKRWKEGGELFADMALERGHRLRGAPIVSVPLNLKEEEAA